ncbi:MAG: hypothetical protein QOF49_1941 [Chloroflexota bacterium]|jgi:hypothetical protein|nr:hypothetical protein [Chloroflexota bacterium]
MQPIRRRRHAPLRALAIAAVTVGLLGAGCDMPIGRATARPSRVVATAEPPPTATPLVIDEGPTPRPEPSGAADLVRAADALADLDSYRVTVVSSGVVPATPAGGRVTMRSTVVQGAHPAAEFTMTGVDGYVDGRLEAVVIGEDAWLKAGQGPWTKSPGGAADFDAAFTTLSPIDLAGGFERLTGALERVGGQRKNGQQAIRYRSAEGDQRAIAAGLTQGTVDVWLATDGGYLVALSVAGTWDVDGTATPISLTIDVTSANNAANRVVPPA